MKEIKILDMRKITRMKGMITPNTGKKTEMKDMNIMNMKKKPNMKEIKILNMRKKTKMKEMKIMNMRKLSKIVVCLWKNVNVSPKLRLDVIVGKNFEHMWTSTQDDDQMNNMLKLGIGPPEIFGSFANCSGGYEKIGFWKKDIYNQIIKQRRLQNSDAEAAVKEIEDDFSSIHGDPVLQTNLQGLERKLSVVNSITIEEYNDAMERSLKELEKKKAKRACDMVGGSEPTLSDHERLRNPLPARHIGSVRASTSTGGLRVRRTTKCSICHVAGHNKATCPQRAQGGHTA
ncbi:hypothetical protein SESBI_10207 [Sesbania bispinosa]|nr:hypothetical protein SESBI_10207 [Sesbania bispinosa]